MTIVPVPFTFEAWVKSSGGKSNRMIVIDSIDVDIPELSEEDLRPGATVTLTHRFRMDKLAFFRHHLLLDADGTVFGPSVAPAPGNVAVATTMERYMSRSRDPDNLSRAAWPDLRHILLVGKVVRRSELAGGIEKHNRDLCAARALEVASAARFVEGVLHRPASEPVYFRGDKGTVTPQLLGEIRGKVKSSNIFPADDQDPLIEYILTLEAKDQDDILERRTIHVHDPAIVTWDRRQAAHSDAARDIVTRMGRYLVELPRETVELWLDLRDRLDRGDADMADTIRELAESAAGFGVSIPGLKLPDAAGPVPERAPSF